MIHTINIPISFKLTDIEIEVGGEGTADVLVEIGLKYILISYRIIDGELVDNFCPEDSEWLFDAVPEKLKEEILNHASHTKFSVIRT